MATCELNTNSIHYDTMSNSMFIHTNSGFATANSAASYCTTTAGNCTQWVSGTDYNIPYNEHYVFPPEVEMGSGIIYDDRIEEEAREAVGANCPTIGKGAKFVGASEKKAEELLGRMIGAKELKVYKKTGRLFVQGKKHGYLLERSGPVRKIEKDRVIDLCIHLMGKGGFPETDNVVALRMAILGDEQKFCKTANIITRSPRPPELPMAACM